MKESDVLNNELNIFDHQPNFLYSFQALIQEWEENYRVLFKPFSDLLNMKILSSACPS